MKQLGRPALGRTTEIVSMTIQKDVLATTKRLAKDHDTTLSKYVTMVLQKHISTIGQN